MKLQLRSPASPDNARERALLVCQADGPAWGAIGRVYRRSELGHSEELAAFFTTTARRARW